MNLGNMIKAVMNISGIITTVINIAYVLSGFTVIYFNNIETFFNISIFDQFYEMITIILLVLFGTYHQKEVQKYWYLYGFSSFLLYIVSMHIHDDVILFIYLISFVISLFSLLGFYRYAKSENRKDEL